MNSAMGNSVKRLNQCVLIVSTLVASWLGMQAIHEMGHVLGALVTGGEVKRVVLHPLTISRTDLARNPSPLLVVWAGPIFGVLGPVALWSIAAGIRLSIAFVLRFFAGFCLIANGAYIGIGSMDQVGDCGEMLRHGSPIWHLWLFGAITIPIGFRLWHRQGSSFGLGPANGKVNPAAAYATMVIAILLMGFGLWLADEP